MNPVWSPSPGGPKTGNRINSVYISSTNTATAAVAAAAADGDDDDEIKGKKYKVHLKVQ